MTTFSRVLLRYGFVALFLWFGTSQLMQPEFWVAFLPEWTGYLPIPSAMLVSLNGWFEIVAAVALFAGVQTRIVAALLALHLAGIAVSVGGAIGVRDGVLALIGFAIAGSTPDAWTLDARFKEQKKEKEAESMESASK